VPLVPPPPIQTSPSWPFVEQLINVGMYDFIKVVEIVTGACFILNIFVPLMLVVEFPVTVAIFFLNVFIDGGSRHIYTGIKELAWNSFLLAAYGSSYVALLKARVAPEPLWTKPVLDRLFGRG
jgi:hypothetical protein